MARSRAFDGRRGASRLGLVVLTSAALLSGCASGAAAPQPSSASASPSPGPTPTSTLSAIETEARERYDDMTDRERVATLLMLHHPGTDEATLGAFMASTGAGGFIVMGDNVPGSVEGLASVTAALAVDPTLPPLVGIDEEGGDVARIPEDDLPAASALKTEPPEATRAAFEARAALVASAGADLNFGVVADVTGDPGSFIFDRVFGATAEEAAARVEQAVLGERGTVLTTLKHFPGHGRSDADSHVEIPFTDVSYDEWRVTDAVPFERGIAVGAEAVMLGHLAYRAVDPAPASLSPRWHDILRDDLGFDGLVVTDDMLMLQRNGLPEYQDPVENAVRAIEAGSDLLIYVLAEDPAVSGVDPVLLIDGITAAVESGRIGAEVLEDSTIRVLEARIARR